MAVPAAKSEMPQEALAASAIRIAATRLRYSVGRVAATASSWFAW